ncbi:MAG: amino acid permease [Desulfarculaceae bacterium]|nr:amino acid permease [Desulfarculaceae bacterium]MCF8074143.1 amino acid permease [Desulfarculaceae bacterium]MCF8103265.1 amino acid permease [Desulfarculaceae bacterium]MCF8116877.1 amino acid permease [Desulfarculaceae bacterium]
MNQPESAVADKNLQEQIDQQRKVKSRGFGTFAGVFTPTLLTILGVIMFLREGWVVGNAGLLGAWLIIGLSFGITACTGLSLSSVTTNIRIGAGGAYSIISQSLGLEVGGSIGAPLYLSQALAVSMYIFGFRAGWLWIFPEHPALLVDLATFAVLFAIAFISAGLAFRIQFLIMAVIGVSLAAVAWAALQGSMSHSVAWWGSFAGSPENGFQGIGFWAVFAVFFPASTGIMAGANMSGELKDPRKAIPVGTMAAIAVSLVIYLALAWWLAASASQKELLSNYTVMIDKAAWGPAVLAGLLGATFSSALASLVGAPRILQALAAHGVMPGSRWFARRTASGEPRNALLTTGAIVLGALMLRDLNAVAPLITMFFLITYAMINAVVAIEQKLGLVSFRPLFRVPRLVPILGGAGCFYAMFIVNPTFGLVAVGVVVTIYVYLLRRHLEAPFGDVRSGMFVALAEWAARMVARLPVSAERTWKSNLLVPVESDEELREHFNLVGSLAPPRGTVTVLGLSHSPEERARLSDLPSITRSLRQLGLLASHTSVESDSFPNGLLAGLETLSGFFFRPNVVLMPLPTTDQREQDTQEVMRRARSHHLGVVLHDGLVERDPGPGAAVNLWVEGRGPAWEVSMDLGNLDLALLIAYKLKVNWRGSLRLVALAAGAEQEGPAGEFLDNLRQLARIPDADTVVLPGPRSQALAQAPPAKLDLFTLPAEPDFAALRRTSSERGSPCLFVRDSGEENALA